MQINTKTLGVIKAFDPVTQFATVEIICNDATSTLDQNYVNVAPTVLIDVMVEFARDDNFCVTFPIRGGEDCIVEFFEQGISHWQYENRKEYKVANGRPEAASRRRYDRSDAACRVVVGNVETAIPSFDTEALSIRSRKGDQHIRLMPNGDILVTSPKNIKFKAGGDFSVDAKNITLTAQDDFKVSGQNTSITAAAAATVKGAILKLVGAAVQVTRG